MTPKFRGDFEDWLDDQASSGKGKGARKKKAKPLREVLPPEEANGTVVEVFSNQCRVKFDDGKAVLCSYRRSSVMRSSAEGVRERSPVAVGDRVKGELAPGGQSGIVAGVCERRSQLARPAPDREGKAVHVIASNIDVLVIVTAAKNPDFSAGLVDRFLVAAAAGGIQPILCVNKIDLADGNGPRPWEIYASLGVETFTLSAKCRLGLDALGRRLENAAAAFCGHSGVGKTSLLNALLGSPVGRVATVSGATGKGRHTTTGAVLLKSPGNGFWIDTPGVREFGLAAVEPETLASYFPEFVGLQCGQTGCLHYDEADCHARSLARYGSYRRILESLMSGEY